MSTTQPISRPPLAGVGVDGVVYALPLTAGGTAVVTSGGGGGGGGTSSAFGAPFPSDGTAIGVERGGDMVALVEGQAAMAASLPVVLASDQSVIPVSVADGSDVTLGAIADAAVQDATGTANAHLRGIIKTLLAGIATTPVYSHTISAGGLQTVTTDALLLAQNLSRVGYEIQNVSLTAIYVLEGTGTCSATNFTYCLPACGTVLDGSSPIYRDTQWQGPVRLCAASGTGKVSYAEKT